MPGANGPSRTKNLLSKVYYDPRGKGRIWSTQVDQTVLVGVRVGHSPLLWALLGTVLEPPYISY